MNELKRSYSNVKAENYLRDTMLRNPGTYANKKRKKPALKQ